MQRKVLAAGVAALAIGAAGCGSGSSDPLTRAEFTKQANRICQQAQARGRSERGETLALIVRMERRKADELKQLTPPAALQARYDTYTRVVAGNVKVMEEHRAAYISKHMTQAIIDRTDRMREEERRLAIALKLRLCEEAA